MFHSDKTILALDLGTLTGIAHNDPFTFDFRVGTLKLATDREITEMHRNRTSRRQDFRILRLHEALRNVVPAPDVVIFEDVEFMTYTRQTQLWSSLRAAVWLAFTDSTLIECVPVGTLKKFATGHGDATKGAMTRALLKRFPGEFNTFDGPKIWLKSPDKPTDKNYLDDNAVDALWLWLWAKQNLIRS